MKLIKEETVEDLKKAMIELLQENLMYNSNLFRVKINSG